MRLAIVILLSSLSFAQGMGGKSGIGGKAGFGGGVASGPSLVQSNVCAGNNQTTTTISNTCPYLSNVTSGNLIVVFGEASGTAITSWTTPTVSSGTATVGTFTVQGTCPLGAASFHGCAWVAPVTGSGSLTVSVGYNVASSTNITVDGTVAEVIAPSQTVDALSAYSSSGCSSCTGGTLTTTGSNRIVLTFVLNATATVTAASPFTATTYSAATWFHTVGSFQQAAAGLYTPTWTIAGGGSQVNVSLALF